ncbi:MAG: GNAT family N-acetyltransferase [Myxococcales bacterium]|nr:GNAT family N-acetyltransferase [Myxococcales bacterium]
MSELLELRPPRAGDAAAIWRIAPAQNDERDSCYAFLLLCTHFADTGLVASQDGEILGFALGYRPPAFPHDLFVWQLGTVPGPRGSGLAARMLEELLTRPACLDARFLCMTRAPGDRELWQVLEEVARRRGASCREGPCFPRTLFARPHVDEGLVRVGPLA